MNTNKIHFHIANISRLLAIFGERGALRVILAGGALVAILYFSFFITTVFSVNTRKNLEAENVNLRGEISQRELSYFALTGIIDQEYAKSLGFIESADPAYAVRSGILTLRTP